MESNYQETLVKFGFKFGRNGAHSSRTMMLAELQSLFLVTPITASLEEYQTEIITYNGLNKSTENTRKLTYRHLKDLYSLDIQFPLFRVFRQLWDIEPAAQAILALQLAYARDPLFRMSSDCILTHKPGELIHREEIEALLKKDDPERFSPASLRSFAQNINSSWTQAGYLTGRGRKIRQIPTISPVNVSYALFQGYLHGLSGERLFNSVWMKLLNLPLQRLQEMAAAASYRGLIDYKESGGVVEVRCHDFLNPEERQLLQNINI
ncbi:MAG: hypothetical protein K9L22_09370 [Methylococcaceae bacterium]|nr:hypothetical protein [Methylococcaceae bacterium]